nr:MAG TPA: hypothetical protein [Caudoviricetes sp.]
MRLTCVKLASNLRLTWTNLEQTWNTWNNDAKNSGKTVDKVTGGR